MGLYDSCLFFTDLKISDCAAWTQAIFTVIAVAVPGVLLYCQLRHQASKEARVQKIEKRDQIEALFQLCSYAGEVVLKLSIHAQGNSVIDASFLDKALAEFDAILAALQKYDPKTLGEYRYLKPYMTTMAVTNAARNHCQQARDCCTVKATGGDLYQQLLHLPAELAANKNELEKLVNELRQAAPRL